MAKKITERDKKYYRMGYDQGERKLKETILLLRKTNTLLLKTNHCIWRELLRLDIMVPVAGVLLTYTEVKKLAKALRKSKASPYRATVLEKKMKKARGEEKLFSSLGR